MMRRLSTAVAWLGCVLLGLLAVVISMGLAKKLVLSAVWRLVLGLLLTPNRLAKEEALIKVDFTPAV